MTIRRTALSDLMSGGALLAICMLGTPVMAQDASVQEPASPVPATEPAPEADNAIVVTGSRVRRDGYSSPTPTTIVTTADLMRTAPANIADAVNQLPALSGSTTPRTVNGSTLGAGGANLLNLRNLGTTRTLILLDSRRVVASAPNGGVDINLLPTALLQRVDVVTGGASAAYGSDAVAGVVNFVLDTKYEGIKGELQGGISDYDDAGEWKADLSAGTSFADGRGHVVVSGSVMRSAQIANAGSRDWYRGQKLIANPAYTPGNGQPTLISAPGVGLATATPGGVVTSAGPLRGTTFNPDGTTGQFNFGNASGLIQVNGTPNDFAAGIQLQPEQRQETAFGHASFDLTDSISVFGEYNYGHSRTIVESIPYFRFGNIVVQRGNPFLPASVAARIPVGGTITIGRTNADLGGARPVNDRKVYRFVAGADGNLGGSWSWNAYYQDGRTHVSNTIENDTIISRFNQAVDAVPAPGGGITCRSSVAAPANGCLPLNIFGDGAARQNPAALSWVNGAARQDIRIHEQVASASIQGEPLSTWAGPISFAAGGEWRREDFSATADATSLAGDFWVGNFKPSEGRYSIKEGFAEVVVPLLADAPLARNVEFNSAVRVTDYSTSGTVVTWKAGLTYEVNDWLRLRGTRSRDIRAPNFNDLFQGGTSRSQSITDPRTGTSYSSRTLIQGNTALDPEIARTWAGGIVLQPQFLPGLTASVDYYDISISDAITTPTNQQIVDGCEGGNAAYCAFVTRNPAGLITQIDTLPQNANNEQVRGLDFDISYRTDLFGGSLDMRGLASHVFTHSITSATGEYEYVNDFGGDPTYATPAWRFNAAATYSKGPFSFTVQERFIGAGRISTAFSPAQLADNHVDSVFLTDINLTASFDALGGDHQFFMAVQNLFDQAPPVAPTTQSNSYGHVGTNTALYDVVGRYFRAGVRFAF